MNVNDILGQEIGKLTVTIAQLQVLYQQKDDELNQMKKVLDENTELKELFEEALKNASEDR